MTPAERLARCVLMFYGIAGWSQNERDLWKALTGSDDATTRVLGDLAREVLQDERERAGLAERRKRR